MFIGSSQVLLAPLGPRTAQLSRHPSPPSLSLALCQLLSGPVCFAFPPKKKGTSDPAAPSTLPVWVWCSKLRVLGHSGVKGRVSPPFSKVTEAKWVAARCAVSKRSQITPLHMWPAFQELRHLWAFGHCQNHQQVFFAGEEEGEQERAVSVVPLVPLASPGS